MCIKPPAPRQLSGPARLSLGRFGAFGGDRNLGKTRPGGGACGWLSQAQRPLGCGKPLSRPKMLAGRLVLAAGATASGRRNPLISSRFRFEGDARSPGRSRTAARKLGGVSVFRWRHVGWPFDIPVAVLYNGNSLAA